MAAGEWIHDGGTSYAITFRLALGNDEPFDLKSSYVLPGDPGDGFGTTGALSSPIVRQLDGCPDGNCGLIIAAPKISPCDLNDGAPAVAGAISISTNYTELDGFTPLELP